MMDPEILIDIKGLTMEYVSRSGLLGQKVRRVRVLEDINLQILKGETLGIVGESGCGKTTLANSLMRFVKPSRGQVLYHNNDLLAMEKGTLRKLRSEIQMVFQNPFSSLNPRMTVFSIVAEPLVTHTALKGMDLANRVTELIEEVGLSSEHLKRHPHEMSGGQAQRVAIARALALNPRFVVLDEPTSALDVSVQAQIVNLLVRLQEAHGLTYMFISHAIGVVQHVSDRIAVLYLGEIVELASRDDICEKPRHPYTQALFSSTPVPDPDSQHQRIILEGNVPSLANPPLGCRFHTRCHYVMDRCRVEKPVPISVNGGHLATCHLLA